MLISLESPESYDTRDTIGRKLPYLIFLCGSDSFTVHPRPFSSSRKGLWHSVYLNNCFCNNNILFFFIGWANQLCTQVLQTSAFPWPSERIKGFELQKNLGGSGKENLTAFFAGYVTQWCRHDFQMTGLKYIFMTNTHPTHPASWILYFMVLF